MSYEMEDQMPKQTPAQIDAEPAWARAARLRQGGPALALVEPHPQPTAAAAREFVDSVVEQRTAEVRHFSAEGDFVAAAVSARHLAGTLDAHARERSWERGEGLER